MIRTTLLLLTLAVLITLSACGGEDKPQAPLEAPPAQPGEAPKGTSIEFGDDGVSVESKDLEVQLGTDTARVVLPGKDR